MKANCVEGLEVTFPATKQIVEAVVVVAAAVAGGGGLVGKVWLFLWRHFQNSKGQGKQRLQQQQRQNCCWRQRLEASVSRLINQLVSIVVAAAVGVALTTLEMTTMKKTKVGKLTNMMPKLKATAKATSRVDGGYEGADW